jgi:hypothetical protein
MKLGLSNAAMLIPEEYPQGEQMKEIVFPVYLLRHQTQSFPKFTQGFSLGCSLKKHFPFLSFGHRSSLYFSHLSLTSLASSMCAKEFPVIVHYSQGNPVNARWRALGIHEYTSQGSKCPKCRRNPDRSWIPREKNQVDDLRRPQELNNDSYKEAPITNFAFIQVDGLVSDQVAQIICNYTDTATLVERIPRSLAVLLDESHCGDNQAPVIGGGKKKT